MSDDELWTPGSFDLVRFPSLEVFALEHADAFMVWSRTLSGDEIEMARRVFGSSINYRAVRVIAAPIVSAPTTLGSFIRTKTSSTLSILHYVLIHELTHVWQFQTRGMGYLSNLHVIKLQPW